jgi:hypothetical protein
MAYNVLKIHGNCDINYVMCSSLELDEENIDSLLDSGLTSPEWDVDTLMLAKFNENTGASSYTISQDIRGYRIQRYEVDYNKLHEVASLRGDQLYFEDYNIRNNKSYQYRIVPIYLKDGVETLGSPVTSNTIHTDWCGWSVIGTKPTDEINKYMVDYDNIWTFGLNVSPEPIRPVYNKNYLTGFGQYPKAVQGQENYLEGGLSCLIGDIKCENYIGDNIDTINKWRAFCNNGELKLLKDLKGNIIPCSIKDTTYDIDYSTVEQITTISFNYVQLMDRDDISVYGLGV